MRKASITAVIILWITSCSVSPTEPTETTHWRCERPPETFRESDLFGTWRVTHEAAVASDTLVLNEDMTYQQIYEKSDGHRFESPLQPWEIEHRANGGTYLHLRGMRFCNSTDAVCQSKTGGGGDGLFFDVCEDRVFGMQSEVVLVVVGTEGTRIPILETAPKGIALMHMKSEPDTPSTFFLLSRE